MLLKGATNGSTKVWAEGRSKARHFFDSEAE